MNPSTWNSIVPGTVAAAQSDDDAIARIGHILKLDGDLARSVYNSTFSELHPRHGARRERQLELLAQQRANA